MNEIKRVKRLVVEARCGKYTQNRFYYKNHKKKIKTLN